MKNTLFIIFGRSCTGKTTIVRKLQEKYGEQLHEAVSVTTRGPRPGEIDDVDYTFVTRERFEEMIETNELVEDIDYNGNYYGLAFKSFNPEMTNIIVVEPNGLAQVADKLAGLFDKIVVIKMEENDYTLRYRFDRRGDAPDIRDKRIYGDKTHFAEIPFDYLINSEFLLLDTIIKEHSNMEEK